MDLKTDGFSLDELWVHDETDLIKAQILTRFFDDPAAPGALPRPFGVFYRHERPCYEQQFFQQLESATSQLGSGDIDKMLAGSSTWEIL